MSEPESSSNDPVTAAPPAAGSAADPKVRVRKKKKKKRTSSSRKSSSTINSGLSVSSATPTDGGGAAVSTESTKSSEHDDAAPTEPVKKGIDFSFRADIERRGPDEGEPVDTLRWINPLFGHSSSLLAGRRLMGAAGHVAATNPLNDKKGRRGKRGSQAALHKDATSVVGADDVTPERVLKALRDPISGVRVGPRKKLIKTYQNCFAGKDVVDYISTKFDMKRPQAGAMGHRLFTEGFLIAVTKTKSFELDQLYTFKGQAQFTGMLVVRLKEAAGLIEGKHNGEVYAKLEVKYKKSAVSATTKHWKTDSAKRPTPKWKAVFKLMTKVPPENLQLFLVLYAKARVGSNEFLGQLELPLDPLAQKSKIEDWYPLGRRRHDEEVRGEVLIHLEYSSLSDGKKTPSANAEDSPELDIEESEEEEDVDVEDPQELLAEIPYEYDDPAIAGDVIIEHLGGGRDNIKAASLVRLIEVLTTKEHQSVELIDDLLVTYGTFTTSIHMLNLLLKRFNGPPEGSSEEQKAKFIATDVQNRVGTFLARWMTKTDDFATDKRLCAYWKKLMAQKFFAESKTLEKYFTKKFNDSLQRVVQTQMADHQPKKIAALRHATLRNIGRDGSSMAMSGTSDILLDLSTDEIAEQLTLMEHQLVRAIRPSELLNQNWNKHPELSPNVMEYISWFNRFCQWAATAIIQEDTPEARAVIISKFIRIGMRLIDLRNFNGIMQILASLEGSAIRRLKLTWSCLPPEDLADLKTLGKLMGPSKNFSEYRAVVESGMRPYVPYLGLHLTDLTFVDDGNEDMIKGHLLNLEKASMTAKCVMMVCEAVVAEYIEIRPMMSLQKLLLEVPTAVWDDNEIYRLSLLREPRGANDSEAGQGNRSRLANIAKSMMKRTNVQAGRELTDKDWNLLLSGAQIVKYPGNEVIIAQGELNRYLFKLKGGKVRVEKTPEGSDKVLHLATMDPPRVFGELSMIMADNRPSVSCTADVDGCNVYRTDYHSLLNSFKEHPDLAKRFYMSQAKKLSTMLLELTTKKKDDKKSEEKKPEPKAELTDVETLIQDFGLEEDAELLGTFPAKYKNFDGTLLVFDEYACFLWVFMTTQRRLYPLNRIQYLQRRGDSVSLQTTTSDIVFSFIDEETTKSAFNVLNIAWSECDQLEDAEMGEQGVDIGGEGDADMEGTEDSLRKRKEILTDTDWGLILDGAKRITYQDGEYIIKAGESYQRVYHLMRGNCNVFIDRNGELVNINTMPEGATFGEMSFINQTKDNEYKASASVVAKGETEVSIIEGYFVNILFDMHPGLEARFFQYLCDVLALRINKQTNRV